MEILIAATKTGAEAAGRSNDRGTIAPGRPGDVVLFGADPQTSVQIGLRTTNKDTLGFNIIDAPAVHEGGVEAAVTEARAVLGDRPVYLSFDIDCLDPSYAPGTGTPVCGGLTSHQAMSILRGLKGIDVIGMDVVEVAPAYDVGEITALAAVHVAMEMLYLYASRPGGA